MLLEHRADPNLSDFAVRALSHGSPQIYLCGLHLLNPSGLQCTMRDPRDAGNQSQNPGQMGESPELRGVPPCPLQGWVPLHYAANHRWASWGGASIDGQLALVQLLASRGADMAVRPHP